MGGIPYPDSGVTLIDLSIVLALTFTRIDIGGVSGGLQRRRVQTGVRTGGTQRGWGVVLSMGRVAHGRGTTSSIVILGVVFCGVLDFFRWIFLEVDLEWMECTDNVWDINMGLCDSSTLRDWNWGVCVVMRWNNIVFWGNCWVELGGGWVIGGVIKEDKVWDIMLEMVWWGGVDEVVFVSGYAGNRLLLHDRRGIISGVGFGNSLVEVSSSNFLRGENVMKTDIVKLWKTKIVSFD
ncbi:hypothetical protein Tco_0058024 [Tanacetum coccineum]